MPNPNQKPPQVPTIKKMGPGGNNQTVPTSQSAPAAKPINKQSSLASAITKVASDRQFQLEVAAYKNGILKGMTPQQRS